MDTVFTVLLAIGAFLLGAVPFSVIIGRRLMRKDITEYGDHNPGAANVFKAGSVKSGILALFLDMGKGVPFVVLAQTPLHLPVTSIVLAGAMAVAGHAFSPFLGWHGGKAIAVTGGVILALPEHHIAPVFTIFLLIGFLSFASDSWIPILAASGTCVYLGLTEGYSWYFALMLYMLGIFVIKHLGDLRTFPGFHGRLVRWVQSRNR